MIKAAFSISVLLILQTACKPIVNADQDMPSIQITEETQEQFNQRMAWWREARFGMFIHWGLYAIPAGEWNGVDTHGEWIRTTAQIPLETYDKFVGQFNPVDFDADEWARIAKDAGMKYMVITSKHHDGFCLWDSKETDFDIMSTPFKRDILKELADACRKYDLKLGFYHSIMDWHHPDYIPARNWETDVDKSKADLDNYIAYMKRQIKELATNFGDIAVFWLDGEWEYTWTHEHGKDLYYYIRSLAPEALINNRVDKGRRGMEGLTNEGFLGDFGTPEQEIPPTGLPGVDWESCMTMNDHWGYNKANDNWKSSEDLIHKLTDIASKGGNYLLNIGPMANGKFPQESTERLKDIGAWLTINGRAIYGTAASPYDLMDWGRITTKTEDGTYRMFLHVFDWNEASHGITLSGLLDDPISATALADKSRSFQFARQEDAIIIQLDGQALDTINTVIELTFNRKPPIIPKPSFQDMHTTFIDNIEVLIQVPEEGFEIRYTLDNSDPGSNSNLYDPSTGINLERSAIVKARYFSEGNPVSGTATLDVERVEPLPDMKMLKAPEPGIRYKYYEGDWDMVPDFSILTPLEVGIVNSIDLSSRKSEERFGFLFTGYVRIPETGIYHFYTESDDGSKLYIDNNLVVDNDGLHGPEEQEGSIALQRGYHSIKVAYFEKTGGNGLKVLWSSDGIGKSELTGLSH